MKVYTDGACKGNPGKASHGYVIYDDQGNNISEGSGYIGISTNNVAEYTAIEKALLYCISQNYDNIHIYSDSNLCVKQLKKQWKVRDKKLIPFFKRINELKISFSIEHVKAHCGIEGNERADELANLAIL